MKIAIIAAMEREVRPLIRDWKTRVIERDPEQAGERDCRRYLLFEKGDAILLCGGIGAAAARRAAETLLREADPAMMMIMSVGFAGALDESLRVGDILRPQIVINVGDGARTECGGGEGVLITSAQVANREQKTRLRKAYGASAVDMEAAAVAQAAQARGVEFAALKVISDAAVFELPPVDRFVADDGSFRSGAFAFHVAMRPWLWGGTLGLARNSARASSALCGALGNHLRDRGALPWSRGNESLSRELDRNIVGAEFVSEHTRAATKSHN